MTQEHIEGLARIRTKAAVPLVDDTKRVEIIILNMNYDHDITLKCIEGIITHTKYPIKITLYNNERNSNGGCNTAKIWNKLIRQSTCGFVMLIDNDAFPQNDEWLERMVKALEDHPEAAVVGPVAGDTSVTTAQAIGLSPREAFDVRGHISGYCMLFRREIFETLGYFDEDFYFYGQESDWIERIIEKDKQEYKIFIVPQALVTHGVNGVASVSSVRAGDRFERGLDSDHSQILFHAKKLERNPQ